MRRPKPGEWKETMASNAPRLQTQEQSRESCTLPRAFNSAVLRFESGDAVKAFDVLVRGGQYGIVGKFTYVVTQRHVALLDEAKIPYYIRSIR